MTEKIARIVRKGFEKIEKVQKGAIFGHFRANFGCFSHHSHTILMPLLSQGPLWCRITVQTFMKFVWTVFEKLECFIGRSGEKRHDCISSRKFRKMKF